MGCNITKLKKVKGVCILYKCTVYVHDRNKLDTICDFCRLSDEQINTVSTLCCYIGTESAVSIFLLLCCFTAQHTTTVLRSWESWEYLHHFTIIQQSKPFYIYVFVYLALGMVWLFKILAQTVLEEHTQVLPMSLSFSMRLYLFNFTKWHNLFWLISSLGILSGIKHNAIS